MKRDKYGEEAVPLTDEEEQVEMGDDENLEEM